MRSLPALVSVLFALASARAEEPRIPHGQDRPPGPALSPQEALEKMEVPPGFAVELVAAEPDVVNPVAMAFDETGWIWITESLEYPRREAGPGSRCSRREPATRARAVHQDSEGLKLACPQTATCT